MRAGSPSSFAQTCMQDLAVVTVDHPAFYTQICNQQGYSFRVGHLDPPCPAIKGAPIEQASWTLFDLLRISWTQIFNLQGYSFRVGLMDPPRTAIKGAHVEQVSWTLFDLLCRVDGGNTQLGSAWQSSELYYLPRRGVFWGSASSMPKRLYPSHGTDREHPSGICKQHARELFYPPRPHTLL